MSNQITRSSEKDIHVDPTFLTDGIISALMDNAILGVTAPTGTGKSTKMVAAVYNVPKSIIFITEPTVIACENLSSRMNSTLGKGVSEIAAESNVRYDNKLINYIRGNTYSTTRPDTRIVYCTIGHLKLVMLDLIRYGFRRGEELMIENGFKGANMVFCDVLMIDEAHNGTLDNDFTMFLYKFLYSMGACVPRLILASATLDMATTQFSQETVYHVEAKSFPVEVEYHTTTYSLQQKQLYSDVAALVVKRHLANPPNPKESDAWIIFCAGAGETESVKRMIEQALPNAANIEILIAHSKVDKDDMAKIETKIPLGKRRFVIGTNAIETSITINDVSGIFDTLTEKIQETSLSGGIKLLLCNISKSSAEQRKGRTGRTKPGFCYRMIKKVDYDVLLNTKRPNEIERVPLHNTIIALMEVGVNPRELFKGRDNIRRMDESVTLLSSLNMFKGNPLEVTNQGRFAARLPFSVYGSTCLYRWMQVLTADNKPLPIFPALSIIILIECFGPSYFYYDKGQFSQQEYDEYFKQYDGPNDVVVLANMWNTLIDHFKTNDPPKYKLIKYNNKNHLNNKKIVEVVNAIRISINFLSKIGHHIEVNIFDPVKALMYLGPIMREVYSNRIYIKEGKGGDHYKHPVLKQQWKMERDPAKYVKYPPVYDSKMIGLITTELPGAVKLIGLSLSLTNIGAIHIRTVGPPENIGAGITRGTLPTGAILRGGRKRTILPSLESWTDFSNLEPNTSDNNTPEPFLPKIRIDIPGFFLANLEGVVLPSLDELVPDLRLAEGSLANVFDEVKVSSSIQEEEEEEDDDEVGEPLVQTEEELQLEIERTKAEEKLRNLDLSIADMAFVGIDDPDIYEEEYY